MNCDETLMTNAATGDTAMLIYVAVIGVTTLTFGVIIYFQTMIMKRNGAL